MDLKQILREHPSSMLERNKVKALLSDVFENDYPKINALLSAYDIGILKQIQDNYPLDGLSRSSLITSLIHRYSMIESTATWAVDLWIQSVDDSAIKALQNAEEMAKQERMVGSDAGEAELSIEALPEISSISSTERSESVDYYTNVHLDKIKGKIFIPCGVGNTDNGFYICGIPEKECSSAPAVFALVYNYLIRNSCITSEDYPHFLDTIHTTYQLNYQTVFRLMIIILQLIKNGIVLSKLNSKYSGREEDLDVAIAIINHYASLFSRLMRDKEYRLTKDTSSTTLIPVSIDKQGKGVYVEDNHIPCNARELWYGDKINYRLDDDNLSDLEYILGEISPFDSFKEGQFAALKNMLNSNSRSICIMPTGSGKSLIFYFASLLQPLPMFVLAPTEILIDDQIRNLKKFHHIDNVSHLQLTDENDFRSFEMRNSLLYLTPSTFQNRHLLGKCRHINNGQSLIMDEHSRVLQETQIAPGPAISYVVLDEIHCLSNWGHDFRPEYLMLSKFLNKYLDRVTFLGFTATANYTVVEDIQKQLDIPQQNIYSPISFEKYNISYHFESLNTTEEMIDRVCEIVKEHIQRNERTLIFTKKDELSFRVAEAIGYEADVFQKENSCAYHLFADEKCNVLVCSEDLGIGVNLPNVQNIIHFGLPVSKNEYVQEIGRAGRANESINSYVFYLNPSAENVPEILLKRELEIPNIGELLSATDNDYSDCYRKLNSGNDSKETLLSKIMQMYNEFEATSKALYVNTYPNDSVEKIKEYIFMLYSIGYVNDWYSYAKDELEGTISIMIDISSSDHDHYQNSSIMLNRVKHRTISYFEFLGSNREQIAKTQRAADVPAIIALYVDWYYSKYLYHHKELFLDFLEFAESNRNNDRDKITDEISDYFVLPFVEIKCDELYYSNLSINEVAQKVAQGVGKKVIANIERINSNRYQINLDCFLFFANLKQFERFEKTRFERILRNMIPSQEHDVVCAIKTVYQTLSIQGRFALLRGLEATRAFYNGNLIEICDDLYKSAEKDVIYYGILSRELNRKFK